MRWQTASIVACGLLLLAGPAAAQGPDRGYAGVKGGVNAERAEDDLRGSSFGAGVVAGIFLTPGWTLDGEFWRPGAIRTRPEDGRHRDTLVSVSARRSFGAGAVRPHLLAGVSIARTEDQLTTCIARRQSSVDPVPVNFLVPCGEPDVSERREERFASTSLLPLVGAGVEIAIGRRLLLVPDVRVQTWVTSVIVRPAVAVAMKF
jgi:hypothetical protein